MSTKLYVEGGGDSKSLKAACRRGFRKFLERAGVAGQMPRIVACGGRQNVFKDFQTAQNTDDGRPMLLVDAEEPVQASSAWEHLSARDHWNRPPTSTDNQCHLMVQVMESWFLADRAALQSFYGQGFNANALSGNTNIEQISKKHVYRDLANATRHTQKSWYNKHSHSFDILATLCPERVEAASSFAKLFLEALRGT